ncbi:MAG: RNA polymerase sigma factor [Candidatus Hydrothermarchaeota archaeon]
MIKEAELVKLAQSGDSQAFDKLTNRYWDKVFILATKYCKLEEDKEDIVQETFIQAWQNIGRFQGNSTFFFWLSRIALNLIYEKRRKKRFKTVSLHSLPQDYLKDENIISPLEQLEIKELKERLYEFIQHLPREEKIVYKLRMVECLAYPKIIRITGQSKIAAERCFRRANSKVSKFLQGENLSRWPNQIIQVLREY